MGTGISVSRGEYLPRNINQFVPGLQSHAQIDPVTQIYRASLGNPVAGANIAAGVAITLGTLAALPALANQLSADGVILGATYGRCLTLTPNTTTTVTITVRGRDYLGQPMAENFTWAAASAAVVGTKAFKFIDSLSASAAVAQTLTVATNDKIGLPFRTVRILSEESIVIATGVRITQNTGTLVQGEVVATTPTANTVDPRGTYDPTVTLAATTEVEISAVADSSLFATDPNGVTEAGVLTRGGYYGREHFFA